MALLCGVLHSRVALRLLFVAGAAASVSGCSDASRFSADPFADPFGAAAPRQPTRPPRAVDRTATGSISGVNGPSAVTAQRLAPPAATVASAPRPIPVAQAPTPSGAYDHWSTQGGTPVTMAEGETPAVLANRYGVPADALVKVNGYEHARDVPSGARLTIPVYRANAAAGSAPAHVAAKTAAKEADDDEPAAKRPAKAEEHKRPAVKAAAKDDDGDDEKPKAKAEKRHAPAKTAAKADDAEDAPAPNASKHPAATPPVKPQKLAKNVKSHDDAEDAAPAKATRAEKAKAEKAKAEAAKAEKLAARKAEREKHAQERQEQKTAQLERPARKEPAIVETPAAPPAQKQERAETESPKAARPVQPAQVAEAEDKPSTDGHPEFRWPARGRLIQGFSGGNDGINIAVPEGTAVKAAEAGVVAYAGNGLKGYGNLVLVRHPNGFVSAYAHNGEIDVKPGEQVTRGQTIAKSGRSGDVAVPQLHFELRKGKTPVDPAGYLAAL